MRFSFTVVVILRAYFCVSFWFLNSCRVKIYPEWLTLNFFLLSFLSLSVSFLLQLNELLLCKNCFYLSNARPDNWFCYPCVSTTTPANYRPKYSFCGPNCVFSHCIIIVNLWESLFDLKDCGLKLRCIRMSLSGRNTPLGRVFVLSGFFLCVCSPGRAPATTWCGPRWKDLAIGRPKSFRGRTTRWTYASLATSTRGEHSWQTSQQHTTSLFCLIVSQQAVSLRPSIVVRNKKMEETAFRAKRSPQLKS